ncbi:MAG: SulP family inorganic anion transporter [Rhodothermales bacterium]
MLERFFPILHQVAGYNRGKLRGDLVAGLTVGVMLIPQGMAYALIAGMPPIYGLYASLVPILVYAIFGTSRQLSVAPVAMMSLLTAAGVAPLAGDDVERFIVLALLLAMMVGAIQLAMGVIRFGFLTNFLSHPILAGFTSAAALIIGFSQLKHLLGLDIPRSHHVHEILLAAARQISMTHWITLSIGVLSIGLLIGLRYWKKSFPGALVVVALSTLLVWMFSLVQDGVSIVGAVPDGLPAFALPAINMHDIQLLFPTAVTISLVGFMESVAVAKVYAVRNRYEIDANQELIGLGLANILGSLFQSFPTTGGFSRTAVNAQAGAQTQVAAIITAMVIGLTLLFFTPLFYYLPKAVLAAIVMVAVFGLIDWREARYLWNVDRKDFALMILTFVATLSLGIEQGIVVGVIASLIAVVHQSARPNTAIEGRLPDRDTYRSIARHADAVTMPGVVVFRMDASLYFGNVALFKDKIRHILKNEAPLNAIVVNFSPVNRIDSSALHTLKELVSELQTEGVQLLFAGVKSSVNDVMNKAGLLEAIGLDNFFLEVHDAVQSVTMQHYDPAVLQGVLEEDMLVING